MYAEYKNKNNYIFLGSIVFGMFVWFWTRLWVFPKNVIYVSWAQRD